MGNQLEITFVSLLQDNYAYLLHEPKTGMRAIVDPSEAKPVLKLLNEQRLKLNFILNTHHHWDHTGGNLELAQATGAKVVGFTADAARIPGIDIHVSASEPFLFGKSKTEILEIPGHTTGHIAYWFSESNIVFTGDTLFAMGCGRLFEGTPGQMWESLQKLAHLPKDAQVYCGHEYTEGNANFAITVDPENEALRERRKRVQELRKRNLSTIPFTIGEERETNPFLRVEDEAIRKQLHLETSGPVKVFTEIRRRKDEFR